MNIIVLIFHAFRDLYVRLASRVQHMDPPGFAFIVHPRNYPDVQRKYPFFKYIPQAIGLFTLKYFWPVVLCRVAGVFTFRDKKPVTGWIITIPLVPKQMIEDREGVVRMIEKAITLAAKKGCRIIGLGALTASFTRRGKDLTNILTRYNMGLTTGAGYTTYNIVENVEKLVQNIGRDKAHMRVAVVGAAGSIGSTSAMYLAQRGYRNFLFVDLERKNKFLQDFVHTFKKNFPSAIVAINHQIGSIKEADVIITATNAPEAMIHEDDLKPGAIVVDDAQPSDIHPDVIKNRKDVIIAEGGAAHASRIHIPFNFGLKDRKDVFSCLAETIILAADEAWDTRIFGEVSLDYIARISQQGKKLRFTIAHFQNSRGKVTQRRIEKVKSFA